MRKLVMGCAVAALVALSARSEARPPSSIAFTQLVAPRPTEAITEVGVASWYGEAFDGNPTANGEIYDMNGLTAASRTLPLGTKLKVTNLRNHRSLVLRINDRGPYIPGRFLDVSKAAAEELGFKRSGLALVEVKVIRSSKPGRQNRVEPAGQAQQTVSN
jgi:peptidoglycan lytic transglycosylase